MKRWIFLVCFVLLSAVNIVIYLNRNNFEYRSYRTVTALYNDDTSRWRSLRNTFTESEIAAARQEIVADTAITANTETSKKVIALGHYLLLKLGNHPGGKPSDYVEGLSTYAAYRYLCSHRNQPLWCGSYGRIFLLFSIAANIPCRSIEYIQPGDHHVVNECYLASSKQWMLVDLSHNMLAVQSSSGYLNAVQFHEAVNSPEKLTAFESTNTGATSKQLDTKLAHIRNYFIPSFPYYYYRTTDLEKAYKLSNKIQRYLLPVSWYDIYTKETHGNALFYIKLLLIVLWLVVSTNLIIAFLRHNL